MSARGLTAEGITLRQQLLCHSDIVSTAKSRPSGVGARHQSGISTEVSLATKDHLFSVCERLMVKDTVA